MMSSQLNPYRTDDKTFTKHQAERVKRDAKRTIVVALDTSQYAESVFEYAVENFSQEGDVLILVHVTPRSERSAPSFVADASDATSNEVVLSEWLEKAKKYPTRAHFESVVLVGDPREELLYFAEAVNAKTLVTGSRGLSAIPRLVLGSVSTFLVHQCSCPVLVVKPKQAEAHRKEHEHGESPSIPGMAPLTPSEVVASASDGSVSVEPAEDKVHGQDEAAAVLHLDTQGALPTSLVGADENGMTSTSPSSQGGRKLGWEDSLEGEHQDGGVMGILSRNRDGVLEGISMEENEDHIICKESDKQVVCDAPFVPSGERTLLRGASLEGEQQDGGVMGILSRYQDSDGDAAQVDSLSRDGSADACMGDAPQGDCVEEEPCASSASGNELGVTVDVAKALEDDGMVSPVQDQVAKRLKDDIAAVDADAGEWGDRLMQEMGKSGFKDAANVGAVDGSVQTEAAQAA